MANTPVEAPPRFSGVLRKQDVEISDQDLEALLQQALDPAFVLVRRLGAGGMGIVYLARDPALKRLVAVKVMSPARAFDPDARARFQREAEAVAAISHPNVVAVHSVGALANGIPYLVMQYVDGPTMADRLAAEGPLDLASAKQILGQVASALDAAHRKGIIHRDIKPANILWDDAAGRALVSDFGIAAILERDFAEESTRLTQTGMVVGTPRYMSPEQLLSEPATERSDIYSLGLLGYDLLTREGPYEASSPNQIVAAHLRDAPKPLSALRPDVDPVLEALLANCLEKDAHARPSADDVARRLQHGASVLLEWPPPGLEELQGAIEKPLGRLLAGAFTIAIPLTLIATVPAESGLRPHWPMIMLVPMLASMGFVSVLSAAVDVARLTRIAIRAARAGYGWGIIAEVLVDVDRDTGALIAGDREYATLRVEQRNVVRRWRVLRAGLRAAAGLWALAGLMIGLPIAARLGGGSAFLAVWSLGIPLALVFAAREIQHREHKLLDSIRTRLRRHKSAIDTLSQLAAVWRDAFDRMMPSSARGHGAFGRIARRVVAIGAATVLGAVGVATAAGLIAVSVGNEASQRAFGDLSVFQERIASVRRLKTLRPAIDPAITPLQAGYAMQSIVNSSGRKPRGIEAPTRYPIGDVELPKAPDSFKDGYRSGNVIRQARTGFSTEQRAYLELVAALPGRRELAVMAHASRIDWVAAAVVSPLPENAGWLSLPLPRFSRIKAVGHANTARAALAVADGKPAEAERTLRETIGAGFAMLESPTVIENLVGVGLVKQARKELVALYEITGRVAEAREFGEAADPVLDETGAMTRTTLLPSQREAYTRRVVGDTLAAPGIRWEAAVLSLAYEPCNDLRQMLFGPDASYYERMAIARQALVKTPGDDKMMTMVERALSSTVDLEALGVPMSIGQRGLSAFARTVEAMTGSKRMTACISVRPFM